MSVLTQRQYTKRPDFNFRIKAYAEGRGCVRRKIIYDIFGRVALAAYGALSKVRSYLKQSFLTEDEVIDPAPRPQEKYFRPTNDQAREGVR